MSARRIWCALVDTEVEVEFEMAGVWPFRRIVGVKSCTAFDPSTAVACRRRCVDPAFRQQWSPALPVNGAETPRS